MSTAIRNTIFNLPEGLGAWDGHYLDTIGILTDDIARDSFPTGDELWMYYCGLTWKMPPL